RLLSRKTISMCRGSRSNAAACRRASSDGSTVRRSTTRPSALETILCVTTSRSPSRSASPLASTPARISAARSSPGRTSGMPSRPMMLTWLGTAPLGGSKVEGRRSKVGGRSPCGACPLPSGCGPRPLIFDLRPSTFDPGDDALTEGADEGLLVAADVVDVDLVEAHVGVVLQVGAVLVQVGRDQHAVLVVLRAHEPGHRLEVLGVADVGLGEVHPAVRPLAHRVV